MKKVLCFLVLAALGYGADLFVPSQYTTISISNQCGKYIFSF
ncbi:MAG: hypothetical protein AB1397_01050 [bacterium]